MNLPNCCTCPMKEKFHILNARKTYEFTNPEKQQQHEALLREESDKRKLADRDPVWEYI